MESDSDTVDTQTDHSSCPSSPGPTTPPPPRQPTTAASLPMDTVILVAKSRDGSKSSVVFRSLLRNRKAPGRVEKIRIIKSPVTEIKNASLPMRANLKQQLQRQQLLEQEKREQEAHVLGKSNGLHVTGSNSITVPRVVESAEVPVNVLQVKTQLQHPTKYHVRQSQKRQVQHFLNEHQGSHLPIQSLPANVVSVSAPEQQQYHVQSSSSAPDPDLPSPLMGAAADFIPSSFDLLGDLQSVDTLELGSLLGDSDLVEIQPSLGASSSGSLLTGYEGVDPEGSNQAPASCPTPVFRHQDLSHNGIMSVQDELWRKERIKKDNHNMIERRRRFNINDRIKELGGLLPRSIDPQNKGNILKASVDYIKSLQDDQRKLSAITEQKKKTESDLRKVLITLNQMSSVIQSHGLQSPHLDTNDLLTVKKLSMEFLTPSAPSPPLTTIMNTAPTSTQTTYSLTNMDDLMMDEMSPVSGDPMLLSAPVTPEGDDHSLDFSHFH
ncbi:microphthalmia-associated transcription factor isoform X2 [Aplysia californica]|uniref:Microphthalmia-associated transcription factor isoform X2 n=1 Tax=Aplysia californica TaxID=6500 RepID=A0ABM1A7P0_APLCA|nr:microphthalmia-associated transcription factor isoform X2 [Aplysia californica]